MKNRAFSCALSWLMALFYSVSACAGDTWLVDLYHKAAERDPSHGIMQSRLLAAREDETIARSSLLPRVDATGSMSYNNNTTYGYSSSIISGNYFGYGYGVMLKQPVYNGSLWSVLNSSRAGIDSAEQSVKLSDQDLMYRIAEAALRLFRGRANLEYATAELRLAQEFFEHAEMAFNKGTEDVTVVNEANARRSEAEAQLLKARNEVRTLSEALQILSGDSLSVFQIPETLPAPSHYGNTLCTDAELFEAVVNGHPSVLAAKADSDAAAFDVEAAGRGHWPILDFSGGYAVSKGSTFLPEVETRQWYTTLNVSIPLFAGFGASGRADRAKAVYRQRSHTLDGVRDDVRRKIYSECMQLESTEAMALALGKRMEAESELLRSVTAAMDYGLRAVPDRIRATQRLAAARRDLYTEYVDVRLNRLKLSAATGTMSETSLLDAVR